MLDQLLPPVLSPLLSPWVRGGGRSRGFAHLARLTSVAHVLQCLTMSRYTHLLHSITTPHNVTRDPPMAAGVQFRASASDVGAWRAAATAEGRTLSQWIRRALNDAARGVHTDRA